MLLSEPQARLHFRQAVAANGLAVFREVPLPPRYFASAGGHGAAVLLKRRQDPAGYLLCIGDGVRYLGEDRLLRHLFEAETHRGWRVLGTIHSLAEEEALRETDAILGLNGRPPRLAQADAPAGLQLVVRPEELAQDNRRAADGAESRFGGDLVGEARAGRIQDALYREQEIAALIRILSKAGKNAACLVGEPGVGKTAVVEGLAFRIARKAVPPPLANARILDVNLSFLAAGATLKNEFEGRMKDLLLLARRDRNVILFLDEVHVIRAPGSDASQMVKSDLGRGRIRCVGATTTAEYRTIEADGALARRFQAVPIRELTPRQTIDILRASRKPLEEHHGVIISDDLLHAVVDLACRHVPDRQFPDKALDLLDEACACATLAVFNPKPTEQLAPKPPQSLLCQGIGALGGVTHTGAVVEGPPGESRAKA